MALKSISGFFDNKLEDQFRAKPYDPAKDRQRVVAGIERTRQQFRSTEPTKGRKWFSNRNGIVHFNAPFGVSGYMREDQFPKFLEALEREVKGGALDGQLGSKTPKRGGGKGWSEERLRRFRETMAAKKKGS